MTITYIGHACFLIEGDGGPRILVDPYRPGAFGGRLGLESFDERVDVVVSTHSHEDHFHLAPSFGDPEIVRETCRVQGIDFVGVTLPHGVEFGHEAGTVTGIRFEVDGVSVFHPGDLGRPLNAGEIAAVSPVHVLLLPVGGTFTIGPEEALKVIDAIAPAVVVPMHYRTPAVDLRIAPLDDFLALVPGHERANGHRVRLERDGLPDRTKILVMKPVARSL